MGSKIPGKELLAGLLVLFAIIGIPVIIISYDNAAAEVKTIDLVGNLQAWSPAEIKVQEGDLVRIRVRSDDVAHGFVIPDFDVKLKKEIYPGKPAIVEFIADRAGTFPFYCNFTCGPNHGLMKGWLVVEAKK